MHYNVLCAENAIITNDSTPFANYTDVIADHMLVTKAAADDPKQLVPPIEHSLPNEVNVKPSTIDDGVHEENTCVDVANDKPRKPQSNMKKAPDAPKRFKSAFIFFSAVKHKEIRAQMGDKGIGEKVNEHSKLYENILLVLLTLWGAVLVNRRLSYQS